MNESKALASSKVPLLLTVAPFQKRIALLLFAVLPLQRVVPFRLRMRPPTSTFVVAPEMSSASAKVVLPVPLSEPAVQAEAPLTLRSPPPASAPPFSLKPATVLATASVEVPALMIAVSPMAGTPAASQLPATDQSPLPPNQVRSAAIAGSASEAHSSAAAHAPGAGRGRVSGRDKDRSLCMSLLPFRWRRRGLDGLACTPGTTVAKRPDGAPPKWERAALRPPRRGVAPGVSWRFASIPEVSWRWLLLRCRRI